MSMCSTVCLKYLLLSSPLVAFIVYNWGWHSVFYVSAVIGLVIAVIWYKAARDTPSEHPKVGGRKGEIAVVAAKIV